MRLLFIRHGDPDYETDSLTGVGKIEAEALAKHINEWNIDDVYLSPLGRARETASYSLKEMESHRGKEVETTTFDWLRELPTWIKAPAGSELAEAIPQFKCEDGRLESPVVWDLMPAYINNHPEYLDTAKWRESEIARNSTLLDDYDRVAKGIDDLLKEYGYVRNGLCYHVEKESTKTLAFFCHFGLTSTILSHLLNISPFSLWQGMVFAPTSVTEVLTEERQQGIASFRAWKLGDVSHLIREGIEPSFAARFTEVYSDMEHRH